MSLEIASLDYEIYPIKPEENQSQDKQDSTTKFSESGSVQYDPEEKILLFTPKQTDHQPFQIKIKEIHSLKESYLNESILCFDYIKENSAPNEIRIFSGKKDTLGARTIKILTQNVYIEIRELKKKQGKKFTDIITNEPKPYQKELLEIAKQKNTIIFLETGMGKTYIGTMLIKEIFGEPLAANAENEIDYKKKSNKKVLCLFQTISLLLQQSKVIKHNTNLRVIKLYGNNEKSSLFNHNKFEKTIKKYDIICATPETIYRYFTFGYLNKDQFELVLIDECHHCKGDHFYNRVLSHFFFDEAGDSQNVKILGLTASPCEQGVLQKEQIESKIIELCNNMNCYIACPKNILDFNKNENDEKIPEMLDIDNPKDNKNMDTIKDIKNYIFHSLIMPFLDLHFVNIFNTITETYKEIPLIEAKRIKTRKLNSIEDGMLIQNLDEDGEEIKEIERLSKEDKELNEKFKKINQDNREQKEIIKEEIAMYILNFYLTLFIDDELKLDEKFMGLYIKNEDICLLKSEEKNCYFNYFKSKKTKKGEYNYINENTIQKFIGKLSEEEEERVNLSTPMRAFIKRIQEDDILKKFKNYTKVINLIIKYLDKEALVAISEKFFGAEFLYEYKNAHLKEYNEDNESDKKFMSTITNMLEPIQKIKNNKNLDFKSSYLDSLYRLLIDPTHKDDKSILFINQRIICEAFNRKLNQIFAENKTEYTCSYVIGVSGTDKFCPFNESDLKKNIKKFREDTNCKILCATNVVEEGIDIPSCNNVINLSDMRTIKEYIQKTGRARKENNKLYLFSTIEEQKTTKEKIQQIQLSISVMKQMLKENNFVPKLPKRNFIQNYNCFKTPDGAKVYYNYAPQIVNEFISKLYNDGYSFNRSQMRIEKTNEGQYIPYLLLPSVLECSFQKIYDGSGIKFDSEKNAEEYFNKYENFYYLKALILLHKSGYLNKFLQFSKNYDGLMSYEERFKKCDGEKVIEINNDNPKNILDSENNYELIAYVVKQTPGYIDLTYNQEKTRYMVLLSEKPLALLNFDLFMPCAILLKLYYFGSDDSFNKDEDKKKWYRKKPKIPYTKFAKMNICLEKATTLKIPKDKMDLINFFYVYSLFLSTDSEMYFYYCIYKKKFDFCSTLFKEEGLFDHLKNMFDCYEPFLCTKQHLKNYQEANLNYHNHLIKYSFILYDEKTKSYSIDYKYIKKLYNSFIEDIKGLNKFLSLCFKEKEENEKLLYNEDYLKQETETVNKAHEGEDGKLIIQPGMMVRNLINYSKHMVMNFGQVGIKGEYPCKKLEKMYKNPTYQKYYLDKYNILTDTYHDYLKCTQLDYNMKLMKYKINLSNLGKVNDRNDKSKNNNNTFRYLKKFHFFPGELLQPINLLTVDQLYMFTLMPTILFKLQNSLIYYYNTKCLLNEFKTSIGTLDKIDLKLVMQSLNARSTLEIENYERLEFLGDAILKFLASIELFNVAPNANRDLLFSLRRDIENNQSLFEKSTQKKLENLLFTSPRTIKRMNITGFAKDENVIFDISYNRSFTKNCYENRKGIKKEDKKKIDEQLLTEEDKKNIAKNLDIENDLEKEIRSDRISIEVSYEENPEAPEVPKSLFLDQNTINDIADNQIKLFPSNTYRFIYSKTLADIVESITALTYLSALSNYGDDQYDKALNLTTIFLKEMDVLKKDYFDIINNITDVAVNNVEVNKECKFDDKQKDSYLELVIKNRYYKFKNKKLAYQAMTHPASLEEENIKKKLNYVNKSYQRLAFLGEAIVELYVSLFVYGNNPYETESNLHKMRICGINHHIISLIACDLKFNDCLLSPSGGGFKTDINIYKSKLLLKRNAAQNKYKIPLEELDNEEFVIILCELFHAYIGAIFVDCHDIKTTLDVLKSIMLEYLNNNATKDTYTEHPKETILNEYMRRRHYFKSLKENGANRIVLKYEKETGPYRKRKMYNYQLIIDNYIIYQENILYSRPCIKVAQEKAKNIFLRVCNEIDRRIKLKMNEKGSYFNIKNILEYLGIKYEEYN